MTGELPAAQKWVVVGAPHTSNWDFPLAMLAARAFRIRISWIGKAGLFRFPFGWFMRWLGGIPAERTGHDGLVAVMAARFAEVDRLILAIAPEGTRKPVPNWRSGFYRIARGAGVPIVPAVIDAERKEVRLGEPIMPTGNVRADMDLLRAFYEGARGIKPGGERPVRLAEEV